MNAHIVLILSTVLRIFQHVPARQTLGTDIPNKMPSNPDQDRAINVDDVDSRLWLQTKTQSGHNWDQVLGLSQRVINKNFEQLFAMYPEMADMYNSNDIGMIDAKLLAPKIIIPGGNTSANKSLVYFQLRYGVHGGYLLI